VFPQLTSDSAAADDNTELPPRRNPAVCLVSNKNDLHHLRAVRKDMHDKWASENRFMSYHVSAKTGESVQTVFLHIAALLANVKLNKQAKDSSGQVIKA
jgi:ribosome biogenesis GTPase A